VGKYPEHEKVQKVQKNSQTIGEFLQWLRNEKQIQLAKFDDDDILYIIGDSTTEILADYYGIDLNKFEQEKRTMLNTIRSQTK
jgi:hypothetical protein